MNRADRMLAALMDGKPHTRTDIQFRKGYFLTNNAASELRKLGYVVNHWREGRVDYYQLETPLAQSEGADNRDARVSCVPTSVAIMARSSRSASWPSSDYASGASLSPVGSPPSSADVEQAPLTLQLTLEAA